MKQWMLLALTGVLLGGCGPKLIPGLPIQITDTPDHRALLRVMESFQQAYQNKDVDALVALASPKFFEDSGTKDTADDYNYDGLRTRFTEHFKQIKKCILDLDLKDVISEGESAHIDYHYVARYLMVLPSGEKWQITDDVNRMKLIRENGEWKIISGM